MLIAAIIIYIVLAILFGPLWPLDMFGRAGFLGKIDRSRMGSIINCGVDRIK